MEITPMHKSIIEGKICPYCKCSTKLVDTKEIYGESYGQAYYCKPCQAWVNCRKGTDEALGRLANRELRGWKIQAHLHFDKIWKEKLMDRDEAYAWLSKQLGTPPDYTHIGMFGAESCKKVIEVSKAYYNEKKKEKAQT
jgi:hypothetical protein